MHLEALSLFSRQMRVNQFNALTLNYAKPNTGPRAIYPARRGVSKAGVNIKTLTHPWSCMKIELVSRDAVVTFTVSAIQHKSTSVTLGGL